MSNSCDPSPSSSQASTPGRHNAPSLRLDRDEEHALFLEGIRLFNDKEFFEAHEAWEDVWKNTQGRKARFYQGLIQAAVTLEHMKRDNPRGVQKVWVSTQTKFDGLPERCMGIHWPQLLAGIRKVIEPVLEMEMQEGRQPCKAPLNWNREDVPRIQLEYDPFETGEAGTFH